MIDRKSTRLNSSHLVISYAVFCLKKKKQELDTTLTPSMHTGFTSQHSTTASNFVQSHIGARVPTGQIQLGLIRVIYFFFLIKRRPPKSPLFPPTPLFR